MKVAFVTAVVLLFVGQYWDSATSAPAPGIWSSLTKGFTKFGSKISSVIPKTTAIAVRQTALMKYTKFFPNIFKNFKGVKSSGPRMVVRGTQKVSKSINKPAKVRFLEGMGLSGNYLKQSPKSAGKFKEFTQRAFKKRSKNLDPKQESANLARELDLPFDSKGRPLQGGPDSPPKKKSKATRLLEGASAGAGKALELTGVGTGIAAQVYSVHSLASLSKGNNNDGKEAGSSKESLAALAKTLPAEGEEAYCSKLPNTFQSSEDSCINLSSDEEESIIDKTQLTYGSLKLRLEDQKIGTTYCRGKVINLADQRPSYVQAFQLQNVENVEVSPVNFNREAALGCVTVKSINFPLCSLRQSEQRLKPPASLAPIPQVTQNRQIKLAWTGMLWDLGKIPKASTIINTCHSDSFFTHITLKGRQDFTYFDRNFIIPQDGAESMVREIAKEYKEMSPTESKRGIQFNQHKWKELWISTQNREFAQTFAAKKLVNYKGHEISSIVDRLKRSNIKILTYTCSCDGDKKIFARSVESFSFTIQDVIKMSRHSQVPADYNKPLLLSLDDPYYKWCKKCNKLTINHIFVPSTSWQLYWLLPPLKSKSEFMVEGNANPKPYVFDLDIVPKKFIASELFYDEHVEFELAYVSLSTYVQVQNIFHHLSFHYFNDRFYFYDDMSYGKTPGGQLVYFQNPSQIISDRKLTIESVFYFRP